MSWSLSEVPVLFCISYIKISPFLNPVASVTTTSKLGFPGIVVTLIALIVSYMRKSSS